MTVRIRSPHAYVDLPTPEFGDSQKEDLQRVIQHNRCGDLYIARPTYWSATYTITLTFKYLTYDRVRKLKNFLLNTVGQEVIYTDYFGVDWNVVVSNPSKDITQQGRYNYETTLELQVIVPPSPL